MYIYPTGDKIILKEAPFFSMCEELQRILGFDWLLLYLQGHLHATTVKLAMKVLVTMLRNQENVRRFREGIGRGGWLGGTENILKNQMAIMPGEIYFLILINEYTENFCLGGGGEK